MTRCRRRDMMKMMKQRRRILGNRQTLQTIVTNLKISKPRAHNLQNDNFQLKLVFDKKNQAIIDYTVGVRQGDSMAGLLFLFLMQAMDESFKKQCALPEPEF
jgi:hypothetical protein